MGPAFFLFAALAAAEPPPATAPRPMEEAPRRFHGRYYTAFEASAFEGCWLDMSDQASLEFMRKHPETQDPRLLLAGRAMVFELSFEGTRRIAPEGDYTHGFGHMGMYRCAITMVRLIDSRRLPDAE